MSNSGGIISAPVTISDVHDVLGESSYDLGTLCMSPKINKWAKYKPVRLNKDFNVTEEERKSMYYGFKNVHPYANPFTANKQTYIYELPRGNSSEPYRIEDFINYDSNATSPVDVNMSHIGNFDWDFETDEVFPIELSFNEYGNKRYMKVSDFNVNLGEMYPAIVIKNSYDPRGYSFKTSDVPFKEDSPMAIILDTTESIFQTDYVEYFLVASRLYKQTFEETVSDNDLFFLPIPSIENNDYSINIYNWQAALPVGELTYLYINDSQHSFTNGETYMVPTDFDLSLEYDLTNYTDNDIYIEGGTLSCVITNYNGGSYLGEWTLGESDGITIPTKQTKRIRAYFWDGIHIDSYNTTTANVSLVYKNVELVNSSIRFMPN